MRALLDVNVVLALYDQHHMRHPEARRWWRSTLGSGWASCPLTQNGFVRVMSQRGYSRPRTIVEAVGLLQFAIGETDHEFWNDDLSISDLAVFDHHRILGPNQITDVYLLALAVKHGGRLATFDRGIPLAAVRGAEPRHLAVI